MKEKIKKLVSRTQLKVAAAVGVITGAIAIATPFAMAATLDSDVQDVASTTQNYLKGQFSAALVYIIPAVLALFVLFWVFKFVKSKMKSAAH